MRRMLDGLGPPVCACSAQRIVSRRPGVSSRRRGQPNASSVATRRGSADHRGSNSAFHGMPACYDTWWQPLRPARVPRAPPSPPSPGFLMAQSLPLLLGATPQDMLMWIGIAVGGFFVLVLVLVFFKYGGLWFRAYMSNAQVRMLS